MKFLMIRWKEDPSYPNPSFSPSAVSPVQSARKFSTVLGTVLCVSSSQTDVSDSSLSVKTHDDSSEGFTSMFDIKVDLLHQRDIPGEVELPGR